MARKTSLRAMAAPIALFSTQFIWFVAPTVISTMGLAHIPPTRYSTGVLAVMHSAQYLWITSYYASRESRLPAAGRWRPLIYFGALVLGGIALFVPGPWLVSYLFHYDFAASFLIFTALINIHHFLLDGAVWRLRDARISALLVGAADKNSAASLHLQSKSTSPGWLNRTVRIAFVTLLLIFAGVDQLKHYLGANDSNVQRLASAEALNPYDASLHLRRARAAVKDGDVEHTIAYLRRAVEINPYNLEAQTTLAKVLIQNQRYEEALDHYKRMIVFHPRDAEALINLGTLASQLNRGAEAIESWRRALSIDQENRRVHLDLAQEYEKQKQPEAATPHYEQFIALSVGPEPRDALDAKEIIYITLKLAQAYSTTGSKQRAWAYCEKAVTLAEQTGDGSLESMALGSLANLAEANGAYARAALCYQRALRRNAPGRDRETEAMDWFNYGQFLRRRESAKPLILACYMKAEKLVADKPGVALDAIRRARSEVEGPSPGSEYSALRWDSVAEEALTLKF
jgi:tetratricopeptide (TPR) repeat protein